MLRKVQQILLLTAIYIFLPDFVHSAIVTTSYTADPVLQNTAVVSEGRIGDLGGSATFELDIGATTSAPSQTAQFVWPNGTAEPFTLTYDNLTNLVSFTVGGNTLTYTPVTPVTVSSDLYLRVRATTSTGTTFSSIILHNMVLNGTPLTIQPYAANPGAGLEVVEVSGEILSNGFTLTGQSTMNWVGTPPSQSRLAYQITVADGYSDLAITKSASPEPVTAGQNLTYTINATNNGPGTATGVTVTDTLPSGVIFGSASATQGSCTETVGTVTCNLGTLANGATAMAIIVVTPTAGGIISNTAGISGNEIDPDILNNTTPPVYTTVNASADLSITNIDSPDPVILVGDLLTYDITITNNGPSSATGIILTDTVDSSLTISSVTPSQGTCNWTTDITCTIGTLSSGSSATVEVVTTTTIAQMVGNTADVTANEDLNTANNSAVATTNVGDLSRLVGISTRGKVETGPNILVGGFSFGGLLSKQILVRGRGPSMSGPPYSFTGTLTNPTLEIYSGATLFATNDDWQTGATQCDSPAISCGTPAEMQAINVDPCQPNIGQTTAPPGCAQEAAMLITLPPGQYTAKLIGVNGEMGKGIIEVYDPDTTSLPKVGGISTRGKVLTGTDIMVGGFLIGAGNGSKKVLIRGRGPSMSGAPYNFAGTLANPRLEVFSGQTMFATIDDWQTGPLTCSAPAISCGTPAELETALMDPCQPNVDQTTPPPGCNMESALIITLPPGAYTTKLKGVNNGTGIGIVEVYEMP